jgi:predicted nucleic acid-binding protein
MSRVEVLAGMRAPEKSATNHLLSLFEWVPVDESIADLAGRTARQYLRSHPGVDPADFVIGATTESLAAQLWTRNRKHFPMLPDLADPYADV